MRKELKIKEGAYFHSIRDIDEAFKEADKFNHSTRNIPKTLSYFRCITYSKPGLRLVGFYQTSLLNHYAKNILPLLCIFKALGVESKKTVVIHFEKRALLLFKKH